MNYIKIINKTFHIDNEKIVNLKLWIEDIETIIKLVDLYNKNINIKENNIYIDKSISLDELNFIKEECFSFKNRWEKNLNNKLRKYFKDITLKELKTEFHNREVKVVLKKLNLKKDFLEFFKEIKSDISKILILKNYKINLNYLNFSIQYLNSNTFQYYINNIEYSIKNSKQYASYDYFISKEPLKNIINNQIILLTNNTTINNQIMNKTLKMLFDNN